MNSKLLGGILLVVGTTIGAGILALPLATAQLGFWWSLIVLVGSWAVMTTSAFIFLEVNLWLPKQSNIISMAGATLGRPGQVLAWVVYLVLLYSILSAYIAGGGDLFSYVIAKSGIEISQNTASVVFTILFGFVVYLGIKSVDYVNRGLMLGKMGAFFLLVLLITPFISSDHLSAGALHHITSPSGLMITAVSFGFLMIIPSLRVYFGDDVRSLKKALLIGTIIPLICYILWDMAIMGVIPVNGEMGLHAISQSSNSSSDLVISLTSILQSQAVTLFAKFFTSICMVTAFLSIALSLSDFLSDGLNVKKEGWGNGLIYGATFIPPIIFVLYYPGAFLLGLNYAGICVLLLMVLLPALMAWRGREIYAVATSGQPVAFRMMGGRLLLAVLIIFALGLTGYGISNVL